LLLLEFEETFFLIVGQGAIDICSLTLLSTEEKVEVYQLINLFWKCKFWKDYKVAFILLVVNIEEEMFCHI